MLSDIVEVRYLEAHRLFLRFSDGRAGELDLQPLLDFTGVFAPLRDTAYFAQVRVEADTGTIVWPNGADLDPDVLHHRLTGEPLPGQGPARRAG
jgi:hypothetical protein